MSGNPRPGPADFNTEAVGRAVPPRNQAADRTLSTFHHAASTVPRYHRFLSAKGVDPRQVTDAQSFFEFVPFMGPDVSLPLAGVADSCPGGTASMVGAITFRADRAGMVEFLPHARHAEADHAEALDWILSGLAAVHERRTLAVFCGDEEMPFHTNMAHIRVGSRLPVFVAAMKRLTGCFDQALVIGPPELLRQWMTRVVPGGHLPPGFRVFWIAAHSWFPLGLHEYLRTLAEKANSEHILAALAGIPMAGHRLHSSPGLMLAREALARCPTVLRAFTGDWPVPPVVYWFDPETVWIEELDDAPGPRPLAVTLTDRAPLSPVIRYRTGDTGRVVPFEVMQRMVIEIDLANHVPPTPNHMFLLLAGQLSRTSPSSEEVLQALAQFPDLYGQVTGEIDILDFRPPRVIIHIIKGIELTRSLRLAFSRSLEPCFSRPVTVVIE